MASYERQAQVLKGLNAFTHRNNTVYNKHDALLHEIGKHRENQAASINFRKNLLESQKRSNYMNEYDRLRGALASGLVKEPSKKYINQRLGTLKELASESIHGKKHSIFYEKTDEQKFHISSISGRRPVSATEGLATQSRIQYIIYI